MAEIRPQVLAAVKAALEQYETEVRASKLQPKSQQTYLLHARHFVRWIGGDFTLGGTL